MRTAQERVLSEMETRLAELERQVKKMQAIPVYGRDLKVPGTVEVDKHILVQGQEPLLLPPGGGENVLNNPTFASDASDWTATSVEGVTFTRDAAIFYDAAGSGKAVCDRNATILATTEITSDTDETCAPGDKVYLRVRMHAADVHAADEVYIGVTFNNASSVAIAHKIGKAILGSELPTGDEEWVSPALLVVAPDLAASMNVVVSATIQSQATAGNTTMTLWIDDLLLSVVEQNDDPMVHASNVASNPGAASRVLKTDGTGLVKVKLLNVGATNNYLTVDASGNVTAGDPSITTTSTDGFFYITTTSGPPTGTPTAKSGKVPIHYDSSNRRIYIYDGAWRIWNVG